MNTDHDDTTDAGEGLPAHGIQREKPPTREVPGGLRKWEKTRRMGRQRFIWLVGVLGWGLGTASLFIPIAITSHLIKRDFWILSIFTVLGFLTGGYFWGALIWARGEQLYHQAVSSSEEKQDTSR